MVDVKKLADLGNQAVAALGDDVIGFRCDMYPRKCSIHLMDDTFKGLFGQGEVAPRDTEEYPFEHYVDVDNVRFFCIVDKTI